MKQLTLGSLFDGIGGFPLAAQRCGIKTVWASEKLPILCEITKRHFPRMLHLGDITQIHGGEIPPVDIISFGSPCQGFSVAGEQKGMEDERSVLIREAIRIIFEMRCATDGKYPTFIIWENVPGAFRSNGGDDFRTVLEEITKTRIPMPNSGKWAIAGMVRGSGGGANVAWRQIDSQYYGVPQRRKRIFLVGDFRAERSPQILFECESLLGYVTKSGKERETVAAALIGNIENTSGLDSGQSVVDFGRTADRVYINADTARAITATDGGGGSATGLYLLPTIIDTSHADDAVRVSEICPTLQARMQKNGNNVLFGAAYPIRDPQLNQNANGFIISEDGKSAPTLSATDRHAIAFYEAYQHSGYRETDIAGALTAGQHKQRGDTPLVVVFQKIAFCVRYALRKLTPLECERLQGFPDCWTRYNATGGIVADTPRYTALGNSLAVPCAERVFRGIIAVMGGMRR